MNLEDKKIAILSITNNGRELALKIKESIKQSDVFFIRKNSDYESDNITVIDKGLKEFIPEVFNKYDYLIFIMATGIVVRTIAPLIINKFSDPGILVMDEKGHNIISLLSGHMGGANEMTLYISDLIGSNPVITTATDVNKKSSLDMIAKNLNAHIDNFRDNVLKVNSMIVNNEQVYIYIDGNYKVNYKGFTLYDESTNLNGVESLVVITNKEDMNEIYSKDRENKDLSNKIIKVVPKDIVIGIGCKKNTDFEHMKNSLIRFLNEYNLDINAVKEIGSIDIKKNEEAIIKIAKYLNVPFTTFTKEEISTVDYLYDKSEWVKKNVGVYSVAEPVAHLLSEGNLIVKKHKYDGITFSIGRVSI
ncbi:cobalt-precorrin 5A hydrolase [Terrisporobacter sp.]